jgi:hypothetical protein
MNSKLSRRISIWLITAVLILGCALPSVATPVPVQSEFQSAEMLGTSIVQTSAAAQTHTALVLPSATLTPTITRTPTQTFTPTPTFIYSLYTGTPIPSETLIPSIGTIAIGTEGDGDAYKFTGKDWTCTVTTKYPGKGAVIAKGLTFQAYWTVLNTGTRTWTNNSVDFLYAAGLRMNGRRIQDLPLNVAPGNTITLRMELTAPKRADTFSTVWTLKVGRRVFCGMRITFDVR